MSVTGHCQLDTELLWPQVTRRWLGTLPHILPPCSQPGPATPLWMWEQRGILSCFRRGGRVRGEGRAEQGKGETQSGKAALSWAARHKFALFSPLSAPPLPQTSPLVPLKASVMPQHTCNRHGEAGEVAYCIPLLPHPSMAAVLLVLSLSSYKARSRTCALPLLESWGQAS